MSCGARSCPRQTAMAEPREFTCRDCGTPVVSFGEQHHNDQDVCATCSWLRQIEDPVEREKLRAWINKNDPQLNGKEE